MRSDTADSKIIVGDFSSRKQGRELRSILVETAPVSDGRLDTAMSGLADSVRTFRARAHSLSAATWACEEHARLDLVVVDSCLTAFDSGAIDEALDTLSKASGGAHVVVLCEACDIPLARAAIRAGARAVISRSTQLAALPTVLRFVLDGGVYIPPEVLLGSACARLESNVEPPQAKLTPRQCDVLRLLVGGKSNKEICRELSLSIGTVKGHIEALFEALGANSRGQAVAIATRQRRHDAPLRTPADDRGQRCAA